MSGFRIPEILVIAVSLAVGYGLFMTVDAIRRPGGHYRYGPKLAWIAALLLLNPLLTKFVGATTWLVSLVLFPALSIAHHVLNRRGRVVREVHGE
jgi:hypothetical protein